jgi:hypothetical protein
MTSAPKSANRTEAEGASIMEAISTTRKLPKRAFAFIVIEFGAAKASYLRLYPNTILE